MEISSNLKEDVKDKYYKLQYSVTRPERLLFYFRFTNRRRQGLALEILCMYPEACDVYISSLHASWPV